MQLLNSEIGESPASAQDGHSYLLASFAIERHRMDQEETHQKLETFLMHFETYGRRRIGLLFGSGRFHYLGPSDASTSGVCILSRLISWAEVFQMPSEGDLFAVHDALS